MSSSVSTFVFADLAGFTALTEAHGDEAAADLAREFCDSVRQLLAGHNAEELKTIGDASMLRVASAEDAVRLGLEIAAGTRRRQNFPAVHIGMHTGSAVKKGDDWFGSTVNLAARVAAAAAGDEVLLTGDTREASGESDAVEYERRGRMRFKNVREPVELYRAVERGETKQHLRVDPVCRMTVAPERCAGHLVHDGVDYCFCSLQCAGAFALKPGLYVGGS
jgi:adenylate cyclase